MEDLSFRCAGTESFATTPSQFSAEISIGSQFLKTLIIEINPLQIRQAAISPNKKSEIRETRDFRAKLIPNSPYPVVYFFDSVQNVHKKRCCTQPWRHVYIRACL